MMAEFKICRRDFIKFGALSFSGLALNKLFADQAQEASEPAATKAKAVIQIFLAGGPCHIDTFDPKPNAGREIIGPYTKAIPTNVDGIEISQTLPLTAKLADKYSIIRGMTHGDNSHEVSTYMMLSGMPPGGELVYPSMGSVISYLNREKTKGAAVPSFISVMNPYARFDESGFIGESGRSFAASGIISNADLNFIKDAKKAKRTKPLDIGDRRKLLEALDTLDSTLTKEMSDIDSQRQMAYSMIVGKGKEAFDLSREPDSVREKYGSVRRFGQQLLLARRLVEAGATYVNVMLNGWDTHKKHFEAMDIMLPALDQAYSALLSELSERGLLKTTIVTLGGEFGRTPKIMYNSPWMGGRNHFGAAFSWVVAGGGFKGGNIVGQTDKNGEKVLSRPVYPWDLSQSIYKLVGIDINAKLPHPTGCVAYVIPREIRSRQSGGILSEIMEA